jgi:creatinine amidohydrolase
VSAAALAALRASLARARMHLDALAAPAAPAPFDPKGVRALHVTGVGSSAAHARFLAALLRDALALPAHFVPLDVFPRAPDPEAALIVFSQALSPNAELALAAAPGWRVSVLVSAAGASSDPARRARLEALRAAGVALVESAGADEFGTLLRCEGPIAGYAAALRLARSLGLPATPELARVPAAFDAALQRGRALAPDVVPALLEYEVLLLASGGYREAVDNLRLKLVEGLLRLGVAVCDPIELAHGPFQAFYERRTTLLALVRPDAAHEPERLARLRAMLDPARHRLVPLVAELPGYLAVFEHEAIVSELVLAALARSGRDPSDWPGRGADGPLYTLRTEPAVAPSAPVQARTEAPAALVTSTWPELAERLARGARLAVLPLGALEQHGPHLPFGTDTWIADELAERLCARLPGAVRLPALALGASSEHLSFPGTLSLGEATLASALCDVARSLARHGFEEIFCFSAHGGNLGVLRSAADELERAARPARWLAVAEHAALTARLHALAAAQGISAAAAGHHAGEVEASIIAALRPGAFRAAAAQPGLLETPADLDALFYPDLRAHAASGTVGDPRGASPDRARVYLDAWVEWLAAAYEGAKKRAKTKGTVKP